ncbi:MAG: hypothetical protein Q9165_008867, partial [Trypethelium subeluteriae]
MEEPTSGTANLAFDVFDRYGRLRKEFKEHAFKRGTGIWQDELDGGYLPHEVEIDTVNMTDEEVEAAYEGAKRIARNFWRSLGFRRIGSSPWFAWASNEHHRCHNLSIQDDYDPPIPPRRMSQPDVDPLLKVVSKLKNPEWHTEMTEFFGSLNVDDPRWRATDDTGNTILHLAAILTKSESVAWIINQNSQLQTCRNDAGETPLEALESHLESRRTRKVFAQVTNHISDKFEGFDDESIMCLSQLKGLGNTNRHEFLRLRYGCSCGQCTEGFLSCRMRFALKCQAEYQHDALTSAIVEESDGESFVDSHLEELKHVPVHVRENLKTNKSMRQGVANLCDHFNTCIQKDGILGLPTKENVLLALQEAREWPAVSKSFLQRGGTVESVGSMLFEMAMDQDRYAGDGGHFESFEDVIPKLPECRNDQEFGF